MAIDKVQFFRETCHLQDEILIDKICDVASERTYMPKECILQLGRKPANLWILVSGVIRSYCVDEGGKEITDLFISQPGSISNNMLFDGIQIFGEKAVDKVDVLEIPGVEFAELLRGYSELQIFWYEQIKDYAKKYWYLRTICANMSLPEQMIWFRDVDPVAFAAANNVQLASFFGASRESVSRLINGAETEEQIDMPTLSSFVASVEETYRLENSDIWTSDSRSQVSLK